MAYDPEARENSNSAMIIAIVAVVLVVLGGLAWYATQGNNPPDTVAPVVTHTETIKEVPVDNSTGPDVVVVPDNSNPAPAPAPAPSTSTTTNVTVRPTAPAANSAPAPAPSSQSETNVTVNPPAEKPAAPPAGDEGSSSNSAGY